MEELNALFVLFRGDAGAVATFVGLSRDIGHDSVLATIYGRLSVVQRACPWAQPDNLPLFLQLLFGETYLVVKKSDINLVCQHLMVNPKPNIPFQFRPSARAMQSGLVRRPRCRFLLQGISTAQAQSTGILQGLHRSIEPTA